MTNSHLILAEPSPGLESPLPWESGILPVVTNLLRRRPAFPNETDFLEIGPQKQQRIPRQ